MCGVAALCWLLAAPSEACVGDCDDSGTVTVDELVLGVNIALDLLPARRCQPIDCHSTGVVTVDCLVQAVNAALSGCPPSPTPSATATPTPPPPTATVRASSTPTMTSTALSLPLQPVQLILKDQPGALLSISGTSAADVYTVGADPQDGSGPYVLHYDGQSWHRLTTHSSGTLWWISVTPIDGAFYMAGENGVVLRYQLSTQTFTRLPSLGTGTLLFGVWGTDANDIWGVGADLSNGNPSGVVWHFDGTKWTLNGAIAKLVPQGFPILYKVWGRSVSDLYVVGQLGLVFHFDGALWSQLPTDLNGGDPADSPLFTVHGNDRDIIAVGGFLSGVILAANGASFTDVAAPGTLQMNGVFVRNDGSAAAVGITGALAFRGSGGWQYQRLNTTLDFHGAWIDPDGGVWAVGGNLTTELNQGILAYGGNDTISNSILPDSAASSAFASAR